MVYFECAKCNESMKKPKVEKHMQSCGSWAVTCIDCNKTFTGTEVQGHTSCISEAKKYQGSLFKGEKESANKGQKKQDAFLSNVQEIVKSASVSPKLKESLDWMLSFENIPRKEKGFRNFASNSMKIWDPKTQGELWEVVKKAIAMPAAVQQQQQQQQQKEKERKEKNTDDDDDQEEDEQKQEKQAAVAVGGKMKRTESKKWSGWKRALDDELEKAGGAVPWKKLRNAMVQAYLESEPDLKREAENWRKLEQDIPSLRLEALASIPDDYLSASDNQVRAPVDED